MGVGFEIIYMYYEKRDYYTRTLKPAMNLNSFSWSMENSKHIHALLCNKISTYFQILNKVWHILFMNYDKHFERLKYTIRALFSREPLYVFQYIFPIKFKKKFQLRFPFAFNCIHSNCIQIPFSNKIPINILELL